MDIVQKPNKMAKREEEHLRSLETEQRKRGKCATITNTGKT